MCDLKVFVTAFPELRYERRINREYKERGRDEVAVKHQYFTQVRPASTCYVEPTEEFADIVLKNNVAGKFVGLDILLSYIDHQIKG